MESLCVVAGKSVWAIRVDLHIIDNGGYKYMHISYFSIYFFI
jgi:exosome complex RNA-binding protein Rrp42 (RNase PH superfamily)